MARRPRRNHTAAFKIKMALAGICGEYTLGELAQQNDIHPNQIKQWRDQLMAGAVGVFDRPGKPVKEEERVDVKTRHVKAALSAMTISVRRNRCDGPDIEGR